MIYGLYTAASGAFVEDARADMIANNLANVNTVGFRKDFMSFQARGPQSHEPSSPLGFEYANAVLDQLGGGVVLHQVSHDASSGPIESTGRKLDLAINGDGFFVVQRGGRQQYTRAGDFSVDETGRLVTSDGKGVVLGAGGGEIVLTDPERTSVTKDGHFVLDGNDVGQLDLASFPDVSTMEKAGDTEYTTSQEALPFTGKVEQGVLEKSTVNPVTEMVNLIRGFRAYEADLRVVKSLDATLDQVGNEVARVPR